MLRPKFGTWFFYSLTMSICLACGCDGLQLENDLRRSFWSFRTGVERPQNTQRSQLLTAEQEIRSRPILEGFERNHDALLRRDDIEERMGQIENFFIASGRFLDLIGIYQEHLRQDGPQSRATPRLIWAYLRLGQQKDARHLLDRYLQTQADNAQAHFLDGRFWNRYPEAKPDADARLLRSWKTVLRLDPEFKGIDGTTTEMLRNEINRRSSEVTKVSKPGGSPPIPQGVDGPAAASR